MTLPLEVDLGHCVFNAYAELDHFIADGTVRRVVLVEGEPPIVEYFVRELRTLLPNDLPIVMASAPGVQREQGDYLFNLTPAGLKSLLG